MSVRFAVDPKLNPRQRSGPEHATPMRHHAAVLLEPRCDLIKIAGPVNVADVGHPARNRDILKVATAVDELPPRKQRGEPAQVQVVVRHLINNAARARVELAKTVEVEFCGMPDHLRLPNAFLPNSLPRLIKIRLLQFVQVQF